jgi:hypothetical protein
VQKDIPSSSYPCVMPKFVCFFEYVINNTTRIFQPIATDGNAGYISPRYMMQMQVVRVTYNTKKTNIKEITR